MRICTFIVATVLAAACGGGASPRLEDGDAQAPVGGDSLNAGDDLLGDPPGGGDDGSPPYTDAVRYPPDRVHAPLSAGVVARAAEIVAADGSRSDAVFLKTGASETVSPSFLQCFASGPVDLDSRVELQATLDHFIVGDADGSDPFSRNSLAAEVGRGAAWAITGTPAPIAREHSATAARIALVAFGSNDMQLGMTYESALPGFARSYWTLVDDLAATGVVPVVTTIMHRTDIAAAGLWVPTYNAVLRGLAQGRRLPFLDVFLATRGLPDAGLSSDGLHANVYRPATTAVACDLTSAGLQYGYNTRNLVTLEALERLRWLVDGAAVPEAAAPSAVGSGTAGDPFLIDSLPFTHMADTTRSGSDSVAAYDCAAGINESGPEFFYRLSLAAPTALRIVVLDRAGVDVDVHLLGETPGSVGCLERAGRTLQGTHPAGTYHLSVDTWVDGGGTELAGEYILLVLECEAGDPDCG